jgi:amidase
VGTETSGSLIAPAMAQGVVALKPTRGLVPGAGIIPLIANNDSAGPVARSVGDAAALLAVIDTTDVDYTAGLDLADLAGVTLGLLRADLSADEALAALLPGLTDSLTALGATLTPAELTDPTGQVAGFVVLIAAGMRHDMMPYVAAHGEGPATLDDLIAWNGAAPDRAPFGMSLLEVLAPVAAQIDRKDYDEGIAALRGLTTEALERALSASGAEALVSIDSRHASFYATAGYPAMTVPLGLDARGAPWGVTLIGRKGQDARLLALAHAVEQGTRARVTPALALE